MLPDAYIVTGSPKIIKARSLNEVTDEETQEADGVDFLL